MLTCSKCTEPSKHALIVATTDKTPKPEEKNENGVKIVRFCDGHWTEVEDVLLAA